MPIFLTRSKLRFCFLLATPLQLLVRPLFLLAISSRALAPVKRQPLPLFYIFAVTLLLAACGGNKNATPSYSLDGPPLAIVGEQGKQLFIGSMERSAMLGQGLMTFRQQDSLSYIPTAASSAKSSSPATSSAAINSAAKNAAALKAAAKNAAELKEAAKDLAAQNSATANSAQKNSAASASEPLLCRGPIRAVPNENGHYSAGLLCNNGTILMLSFRTLGPDQGIGLGRFVKTAQDNATIGETLIFYFHPWQEEAQRRLNQEKSTLLEIIKKGQNK